VALVVRAHHRLIERRRARDDRPGNRDASHRRALLVRDPNDAGLAGEVVVWNEQAIARPDGDARRAGREPRDADPVRAGERGPRRGGPAPRAGGGPAGWNAPPAAPPPPEPPAGRGGPRVPRVRAPPPLPEAPAASGKPPEPAEPPANPSLPVAIASRGLASAG